jgi:hypothetical protein
MSEAIAPLRALFAGEAGSLDVRVQAAFGLALLEPEGPSRGWLEDLLANGEYHAPTLREILDEIRRR